MGLPPEGPVDPAMFEKIVEEYADRLFNIARRITGSIPDAEDAVQDAFLSAYQGWAKFRGESSRATWLYRIAVNAALTRVRRRVPVDSLEDTGEADLGAHDWTNDLADRVEARELQAEIESGIVRLPEIYRLPLILRDVEGLSTTEAAQVLEIGESALKTRLHRARLLLRQHLVAYFHSGH